MLYNGERHRRRHGRRGRRRGRPARGTRLTALGQPNSIAVIAVAERGTMFFPGAAVYMEKIAVGPDGVDVVDINASPTENVKRVAEAKGVTPREISVVVLERERHDELIAELREAGAKVNLIRDGDVAPAIAAAQRGHGRRHAATGSAARPRASSRPPRSSASAAASRASCGRATTRSGRSSSTPASTPSACSRPTTSSRATTSSSRRRASRPARCSAASATSPTAPSPTRSRCAPAPAPSGGSRRSTTSRSSRRSPAASTGNESALRETAGT